MTARNSASTSSERKRRSVTGACSISSFGRLFSWPVIAQLLSHPQPRPAGRFHLQGPGRDGDHHRVHLGAWPLGTGQRRELVRGQPFDLVQRQRAQRRGARYEVGEKFGARVRRVTGAARRDAGPDAVLDAQFPLHHGPGALVVGEPGKRHAHIPTMRRHHTARLMVFAGAVVWLRVADRGGTRDDGDDGPGAGEDPVHAARVRPRPAERVFKTLVAEVDGALVTGVVPVGGQLDLKALAAACGGKKATMALVAAAERATGYVAGGISPVGQRRRLPVVVDASAMGFATVFCSAGRRGLEIELAPADLVRAT